MATKAEKEKLVEVLKFTPRTYKIRLWGYGGEYVMGTVDRKIYDYFRQRRLSVPDYAWDGDYVDEHNIPEDMQPFYSGQYYDCDDLGHAYGVDLSAGTMEIEDENGETVYTRALDTLDGCDIQLSTYEEVWIDMAPKDTVVYFGYSSDKGTFFESEIPLTVPFDPEKLLIKITDIDGNEIVTGVEYDGVDLDNWGGDTNGKGSDYAFYIAGSNTGSGYERYRDMDDIKYTLTEWYPAKTVPVRLGKYEIETKDGYKYQANWNGEYWHSDWNEEEKLKVKQWRGIAYDPDEHFLRSELDQLAVMHNRLTPTSAEIDLLEAVECVQCEWRGSVDETYDVEGQMVCPECREPVEFTHCDDNVDEMGLDNKVYDLEDALQELKEEFEQLMSQEENTGWPFGPAAETTEPAGETTSTWWTVKTYHKKNCEQVEYFRHPDYANPLIVRDGFRWCEYNVETNDGNFPEFEFRKVPGGNDAQDSLDMNCLYGNNIENSELVEMNDGGCWGDIEYPEDMSEEEQERLAEFIEENGTWALEDDEGWSLDDTEVWVWGPLEVTNEDGSIRRIIIADDNGNVNEFQVDEE